jgi:hypothetical protein
MPLTSFTIGGAEFNPLVENFEIRETSGAVSTLTCEVVSVGSPILRPKKFQTVIVAEDGVRVFAGHITQTRERGHGGPNLYSEFGAPEIVTTITAEDYNRYAERVHITETVAEGTSLEAFLIIVVTYLAPLGVTLHGSQVTGPSLPAMDFVRKRALDVLTALSDATGYTWRIDYDKKLRMWAPGDLPAPFDVDEFDNPPRWTGDVEVEEILGDEYANRVIVTVGPITEENRVEAFTGDGVTDTFTLNYQLTSFPYGLIHVFELDGITPAGGETFGVVGTSPTQWEYDSVTNSITRTAGVTDATKVYKLTFNGFLFLEAMAEDAGEIAANGLYEYIPPPNNDLTDQASADAFAAAILAERLLSGDQIVWYETRFTAPSLRAGQEQNLTATARDVFGSYLIADMRVRAETPVTAEYATSDLGLIRAVRAKKHQLLAGKWQHTYRDWLERGGGGGVSVGAGPAAGAGPAPPDKSVQFNRNGSFGGDASFTYYEDTNSVVMGLDSSITAENPESCQVWGNDCHIADPP